MTVAVVTGATRGVGKGIALALGDDGATVYVTGRSTVDDAAGEVTARGGSGIAAPRLIEQARGLLVFTGGWDEPEHCFGDVLYDVGKTATDRLVADLGRVPAPRGGRRRLRRRGQGAAAGDALARVRRPRGRPPAARPGHGRM